LRDAIGGVIVPRMNSDKGKIFLAMAALIAVVVYVAWPRPAPTPRPPSPGEAAPPIESLDEIRIGSWNIEWLGQANRRSGPASGIAQSAEDLADYIEASGVRVLALQEVAIDAFDGSPTNATLSRAGEFLDETTGGDWWHAVFRSSSNQNTGVMWDATAVTLLTSPTGDAVLQSRGRSGQDKPLWSRPPVALHFSAGEGLTDFVIIPIHMKSNYGGDFAPHRAEEAQALAAALPAVERELGDRDVFVIGDTNSSAHDDDAIRTYERAGLTDLNSDDQITYWRGAALDRVLVPMSQPEFASPRFEVFFDDYARARGIDLEDFKTRWSDHLMVVFTLDVMDDDD